MSNQNTDLETIINALIREIKPQKVQKPDLKTAPWVENRFGLPDSISGWVWRFCWLVVIPAIATLLTVPLAKFAWVNGYPMLPIVGTVGVFLVYGAVYQMAYRSTGDKQLKALVDWQMSIPPCVFTLLFFLDWLKEV